MHFLDCHMSVVYSVREALGLFRVANRSEVM